MWLKLMNIITDGNRKFSAVCDSGFELNFTILLSLEEYVQIVVTVA